MLSKFLFSFLVLGSLQAQTVEYRDGPVVLEGFLALPSDLKKDERRPAVIVVHDWMGLGDYAQMRAKQLASLGYIALAADIYGQGVRAKSAEEASQLAGKYKADRPLLRRRVQAALDFLKKHRNVNKSRIAAMGYCFGGTTVLELARSGADIVGTISFHGGLSTPMPKDSRKIRGRVLALHGADDPYVPQEEVAAFQEEMREAKVDWEFVSYGGAVHSFTNPSAGDDPSKGAAYNKKADERSFEAMKTFLSSVFK